METAKVRCRDLTQLLVGAEDIGHKSSSKLLFISRNNIWLCKESHFSENININAINKSRYHLTLQQINWSCKEQNTPVARKGPSCYPTKIVNTHTHTHTSQCSSFQCPELFVYCILLRSKHIQYLCYLILYTCNMYIKYIKYL
jgi:hypothetical protein